MLLNKDDVKSVLDDVKNSLNEFKDSSNVDEIDFYSRNRFLSAFEETCEVHGFEVELEEKGKDEVYSEWSDAVNMSASELRKWSKNPCSREASVDPVAVIKRNLRLLDKNKEDWTSEDVEDAQRTVSFVNRMKANKPSEPREGPYGCPSEWAISLLNWAFNPFSSVPKPSGEVKDDLDPVEEVSLSGSLDSVFESLESLESELGSGPVRCRAEVVKDSEGVEVRGAKELSVSDDGLNSFVEKVEEMSDNDFVLRGVLKVFDDERVEMAVSSYDEDSEEDGFDDSVLDDELDVYMKQKQIDIMNKKADLLERLRGQMDE